MRSMRVLVVGGYGCVNHDQHLVIRRSSAVVTADPQLCLPSSRRTSFRAPGTRDLVEPQFRLTGNHEWVPAMTTWTRWVATLEEARTS
ncbi:MAG: hypothetical protein JWR11_862 [Mycobacterium sp.]|jgi:hypothetical protein|nr:hypothetical protein [Mycobacterium sp.]MDT5066473.1 hypothetical protein [Mycobacterium sp.]